MVPHQRGNYQASTIRLQGIGPIETQIWDNKGLKPDEAVAWHSMRKDLGTYQSQDKDMDNESTVEHPEDNILEQTDMARYHLKDTSEINQ